MVGLNLITENIYMRDIVLKTLNLLAYEKNFIISFCSLLYVCSSVN